MTKATPDAGTKRRKTAKKMIATEPKPKTGEPEPGEIIRSAMIDAMNARGLTRYAVAQLTGVPTTVCYTFLRQPGEPDAEDDGKPKRGRPRHRRAKRKRSPNPRGCSLKHLETLMHGLGLKIVRA